ncbi:efflux RND transporter periplasmic adaptor subunit [Corallococcus llansteffanensis]|uniref:efflux RND transporter periplasmic adaptor subunit n=1 Tax=Corallococcus llansteffanensis TaxID=2316731 RepID=UPI001315A769|nr:HlyD family efflux transporter periplasmic adaptor subunit [Corallococcus llansteffanensis]
MTTRVEHGWLGVFIAEAAVDLSARAEGVVESVRVQVGTRIRQGEVVAVLEGRPARQALAVAEAELLSIRAEHAMAVLERQEAGDRLKRRVTSDQVLKGALSEEELATARYQERVAGAKLDMVHARVVEQEARTAHLRRQVEEASIRAPFDGVVARRFVHPGEMVRTGQPLLHVLREGSTQVRVAIPAARIRDVSLGMGVVVEVDAQSPVLQGHVAQVAPEVDVASLMVFAIVEVDNLPSAAGLAGTVVRVRPTTDGGAQANAVPPPPQSRAE